MTASNSGRTGLATRRNAGIIAGIVVVALVVIAGYGLWYLFLRPSGPPPVGQESLAPLPSMSSNQALPSGGVEGDWKVDTSIGSFSDSTSTFVGYRVQEQLASIGANTAVGRTPNVTGTMTIAGTQVTAVNVTADLTALQSDDQRRDGQLVNQGIETGTYPTATFKLTAPIELGSIPADGQEIDVTATGDLTLHGVTKSIQIPLKAKLSGSVIQIVGSTTITFSDFNITPPSSFAVLSIANTGTMELQLYFTHA